VPTIIRCLSIPGMTDAAVTSERLLCRRYHIARVRHRAVFGGSQGENCFGFGTGTCYDVAARLIDVVRSSSCLGSNPCLHHIPIELQLYQLSKDYASPWNKEQ